MKKLHVLAACAIGAASLTPTGCSTAPKSEQAKTTLRADVESSIAAFKAADPTLGATLEAAAGYAVFPDVGKGGIGVGGAYGRGEVFEKGRRVGFCDMSQASIGLQLGAQTYRELVVFKTGDSLSHFKDGKFAFAANASAVELKAGASTAADYSSGAAVFTQTKGGLMYEASVGGQRFTFEPL